MSGDDRLARSLGLHRVLDPPGALPQAAWRLDATTPPRDDELVLALDRLVLDAASARQLVEEHGADDVADAVAEIARERGKVHNAVTGSGGIACGTVAAFGSAYPATDGVQVGARVATLVSLTLTPLALEEVGPLDAATHQLPVRGRAILPPAAAVAALPDDLAEELALAALDVAGAPSQVAALAPAAARIFVLGAGTAGLLAAAAARRSAPAATIVVGDASEAACERASATGTADAVVRVDARNALATAGAIREALGGGAALTVAVVDSPGCEAACFLATDPAGTILFFSMATSFTAAALGAEGIGSGVRMLIGNGFSADRGALALDLVRSDPALAAALARRPAPATQ